ncbi:MAG: cytochrome-c peroxidase [Pseudomonadota bacterium]|nr:cytochrome-c peroxidase [Pseudomonadota bacterium]
MHRALARCRLVALLAAPLGALAANAAPSPAASGPAPFYGTWSERRPDVATLTALGRQLFFEPALSASGRMNCASCHDPAHAWGPPNHRPTQWGGAERRDAGVRAVPSLKYRQAMPPFTEHFFESDGNDSEDQGPTGGLGWDGRADSAHEQAAAPLLSPFEMANTDIASVIGRLQASPSAAAMREAFGPRVFAEPRHAWNALVLALEVFQQNPADFYPYDSKYDAYLRRQAPLSDAELRGLAAFNDIRKGNCAQCHPSAVKRGAFPQFTDAGHIALGVPRNTAIPANGVPGWHDLGLCGPLRIDLRDRAEYCGLFRTPSLRNVALRGVFFHNGRYTRLADAVRFYSLRDTQPSRIYPRNADGTVRKYDDLPPPYRSNVNTDPPFGARPGGQPVLSEADVADIVAFLGTLTDGYKAPLPAADATRR